MFIFPFNVAQETVRRTRSKSSDYMYFDKNTTTRLANLLGPKLDIFLFYSSSSPPSKENWIAVRRIVKGTWLPILQIEKCYFMKPP